MGASGRTAIHPILTSIWLISAPPGIAQANPSVRTFTQSIDRAASWLLATRIAVSPTIRLQLEAGLFASVPIFLGGVFNSIAVAAIAAWRQPIPAFLAWLAIEIALAVL